MTTQQTAPGLPEESTSDRYIRELEEKHGYDHPLAIAARLEQNISQYGSENCTTLFMFEAMGALRKGIKQIEALQATIAQQYAALEGVRKDSERLDWIAGEYVTAQPFTIPTPGGDDADVGWKFTQHHMGRPEPVILHRIGADNLRLGIDEAMSPTCLSCGGSGDGEDESCWCKDCKGSGRTAQQLTAPSTRLVAIGEVKENGVTWYGPNPHDERRHPSGTKFYAATPHPIGEQG